MDINYENLNSNMIQDWAYADCDKSVYDVYTKVRDEYFSNDPFIKDANVRFIFYTKKKSSKGKVVPAYISYFSEFEKYLDSRVNEKSADYLIFIDYYLWNVVPDEFKERIMRYEIRHFDIYENRDGSLYFGIKNPDFTEFSEDLTIDNSKNFDINWKSFLSDVNQRIRNMISNIKNDTDE